MARPVSIMTAPPRQRRNSARTRWLVLFNCQGFGFANSLTLICPDIEVEVCNVLTTADDVQKLLARIDSFDRILMAPEVAAKLGVDLSRHERVWRVPSIQFSGYHPDVCYLAAMGRPVAGPLGGCQSMIALAAFRCGLSEDQTLGFYREDVYAALGYLNTWDAARDELINRYKNSLFDISQVFIQWSRGGPFMYTINHPTISCLYSLAKLVIEKAGLETVEAGILPHDNLANGPIFPVYPEIAATLGIRGSYLFKLGGGYRCIPLDEFVSRCFAIYRSDPAIEVLPRYSQRSARAVQFIEDRK